MGCYNRMSARWSFGALYSRGCFFQGALLFSVYGITYKNIWIPELMLTMKKEDGDRFACNVYFRVTFISLAVDIREGSV